MNTKKVLKVLNDYRQTLCTCTNNTGSPYNNTYGCGNCGDLGPSFGTLRNLTHLLAMELPKAKRKTFLKAAGY